MDLDLGGRAQCKQDTEKEGYMQSHRCMVVGGCRRPWHPGMTGPVLRPGFLPPDGAVCSALGHH